uniref:Uncharacterized protein n=1 Tax=Setaria italica TaxID=4555 RepID=K3YYY4_SETIT
MQNLCVKYCHYIKTDLAQHNHFTKALRNWGSNYFNNTPAEVDVEARDKDRKLISYNQLEKQYYDWIKEMHDKYDVEMDGGDDEPTLIINPKCKERLGISNDVEVIRVHRSISRKGKTWRRGDHLQILTGATGRMKSSFKSLKNSLCTTLEYIVVEGLQGDVCGEFTHVLMPLGYSDEQGCLVDEAADCMSPNIYIQESVSFPVSIIDNRMCQAMDDDAWNKMLTKKKEKAAKWIEIIRNSGLDALGLEGDLPYEGDVMAGYQPPHEIVAVLRPGNYMPSSTCLLETKYIVKDDQLEMVMEVRNLPRSKDCPAKLFYEKVKKPSSHNGIHGLYVFPLREASCIFRKSGVYQFIFSVSCRGSNVIQQQTTITVCPDLNSRRCLFSVAGSSTDNAPVDIRLGYPVRRLAVKSVDQHGNKIPFLDTSGIIITILNGDDVLAQVNDVEVELSSDLLTMNVMLDILRPKYEAKLRISSSDNEFSGICQCKVKPGLPSIINMDMSLFSEENLIPGRVIDNVLLEVLDQFSNHVEEGTKLNVHVDGLCFLDKKSSVQKVNGEGFIDLCGALKVLGGFGSEACIAIYHHKKKIFSKIFQVVIRELKAVNVPETCPAGSFLEIIFEISDSDGLVDESIDGPLHTLNITSNELSLVEGAQYGIKHGRCVVSHVQLPHQQGKVTIVACHTHYPDLEITIQLQIQPFDLALTSFEDGTKSILSDPISSVDSSNLLIPCQLAPAEPSHLVTYVKDVVKKTKNKVGDTYSKMKSTEKILGTLSSSKDLLEEEIVTLKAEVGPIVGSFIDAKELIRNKIREKIGTAAFVLCSSGESFMEGVVGIVALLGTVPDRKIGRMLAVYLGKDGMLSVVCKTMDAANYIEKYNNHGDVDVAHLFGRPYKGGLIRNSPQKELNLVGPFRHVKKPKGFKGFAVNMINLSDENLNITTSSGHGLRETLLYSLFGVLQVYETRNDMFQAMDYLNGGAISLDGGVIKGKGKILLVCQCCPPQSSCLFGSPNLLCFITFPVVSPKTPNELKAHPDVIAKTRKLEDKVKLLEATKTKISQEEKVREELYEKFNKRKRKFEEISEIVTQPRGNELAIRRTPVKEEMLDP